MLEDAKQGDLINFIPALAEVGAELLGKNNAEL